MKESMQILNLLALIIVLVFLGVSPFTGILLLIPFGILNILSSILIQFSSEFLSKEKLRFRIHLIGSAVVVLGITLSIQPIILAVGSFILAVLFFTTLFNLLPINKEETDTKQL